MVAGFIFVPCGIKILLWSGTVEGSFFFKKIVEVLRTETGQDVELFCSHGNGLE